MTKPEEKTEIYSFDDDINFGFDKRRIKWDDWTSILECPENIVFLCKRHNGVRLTPISDIRHPEKIRLVCPQCKNESISSTTFKGMYGDLQSQAFALYAKNDWKNAKLIRVDDWYMKEVKKKQNIDSDYWIDCKVSTDKDGDTMIMLLIGNKNSTDKAQYFIKPEKLQLTSDHKDLDPAKIISKIEVTLKDRILKQEYDE